MREEHDRQLERIAQPPPLRERVHKRLEELIISGYLEPGERLVETELATQLGVSRGPVREALQSLSKDGWVDIRPRHGAYVHHPSVVELEEFFEWRNVLEVETARRAVGNVDEHALVELRELLERGEDALLRRDEGEIVALNWRFHDSIAQLARNRFLLRSLEDMNKRLRWYFRPVAVTRAPESWREHAELVEALAKHDVERAVELTRAHTEATRTLFRERLQTPSP